MNYSIPELVDDAQDAGRHLLDSLSDTVSDAADASIHLVSDSIDTVGDTAAIGAVASVGRAGWGVARRVGALRLIGALLLAAGAVTTWRWWRARSDRSEDSAVAYRLPEPPSATATSLREATG
ncbi:MAG: hypothetical protein KDB21_00775 [Acidimicrobiales bacterium]|nr:hypothetical protein [Acidimicrobiales bacterium]